MARATKQKPGRLRAEDGSYFLSLLRSVARPLLKTRRKIALFAAACLLAGSLTVFVVVASGYFCAAWFHDRDIRGGDRKFLDNLVQKPRQEDVLDSNPLAAIQNIDKASGIGSWNDPAPKAELVVNSHSVKRAELVVHSDTVKPVGRVQGRH